MTRQELFLFSSDRFDILPDYPFEMDFDTAVLRHRENSKWFALVMHVGADKLGYSSKEILDIVTLKSLPMLIDELIETQGFHRAYHMNKKHWMSIELRVNFHDEEIKRLLKMSFRLTDKAKIRR